MSKKIVIDMFVNQDYTSIHKPKQKCRICGCDDDHACKDGCFWVENDLCSQCYEKINLHKITFIKGIYTGNEKVTMTINALIIADELESYEKAEGFIYGYIEAKNQYDQSDCCGFEFVENPEVGKYYTIYIIENYEGEKDYYFFDEVQS